MHHRLVHEFLDLVLFETMHQLLSLSGGTELCIVFFRLVDM